MTAHRLAAALIVLVAAGVATAQSGPQLLTVFPPGAKAGATVEVTLSGSGFDGDEKLLFSDKGFKAERLGTATVDPKAPKSTKGMKAQPTASVKFKVTAPKDGSGMFDVRVVSQSGLSNPRAFVVGDLAEVNEVEPNNDVGQAQRIDLETTVNGAISAPTDVDFVRFKAKGGQNVVVYCLTTSIDSRLSADLMVSTADGRQLAANRGYRDGDAVLDFKAPTDGEYLVRVAQFAYTTGGSDHFYRLTVTTRPWVDAVWPPLESGPTGFGRNLGDASKQDKRFTRPDGRPYDVIQFPYRGSLHYSSTLSVNGVLTPSSAMIDAVELPESPLGHPIHPRLVNRQDIDLRVLDNDKNATADTAQAVKLPCDIAGRIGKKNDRHYYSFTAKKGEVWTLEVFADRIGSPIDAYFILTDDKGKVIAELDDGPDSLSPNQFYTKSDDPARYRFTVPADGKYRVMVSSRDAGIQFGVREQYVLRIAKENPDFRFAVMPLTPHLPDAGTVARGGAVLFSVFVFRLDGFNEPIALSAAKLPKGATCPPQSIAAGQTTGTLVILANKDAADWDGFITITGTAGDRKHTARPFTVTWPLPGVQPNQVPNQPTLTRMDRGPGLALAVRGEAPFALAPVETNLNTKAGGKLELTLKVTRDKDFKDAIQVFSATPNFGPRRQGNQPPQPLATIASDKKDFKLTIDVQQNTPPGTYTLVLQGRSGAPQPKTPTARPVPIYPTVPITVVVGKR